MIAFMQAQFSLELARFTHHLSHDIEFHGKLLASQNRGMEFKESILRIQVFYTFFLAIVCGAHNVFCCNQIYVGVVFLLLCTFFLYFFSVLLWTFP
jgi:hypothetical protein